MDPWNIFPFVSGYERVGDRLKLYIEGPVPVAS